MRLRALVRVALAGAISPATITATTTSASAACNFLHLVLGPLDLYLLGAPALSAPARIRTRQPCSATNPLTQARAAFQLIASSLVEYD